MTCLRMRLSLLLLTTCAISTAPALRAATEQEVKIGNYFVSAPYGIAIIVDDSTAFLMDPVCDEENMKSHWHDSDPALTPPGVTSPDFTFAQFTCHHDGATIHFTWGRSGHGAVVATLETDRKVSLPIRLPGTTWPHFHAVYMPTSDGLTGYGVEAAGKFVPFAFRATPAPAFVRANTTFHAEIVFNLDPQSPTHFVAGVGDLPALDSVAPTLAAAQKRYAATRISAQGDWGDFLSPIGDNLNNARLYSSDDQRIVNAIGRGWWMRKDPDLVPYFVWDFFFDGFLTSLEDPTDGKNTMRAVLSFQTPDGRVPSFSHWDAEGDTYDTLHRSMPPIASLAVWRLHEHRPDPAFLAEVYPHLVRWHDWWMTARDGNHNGLLEWGSEQHYWQGAQYETGWDDNVAFADTLLVGNTQNADAVDLSSLWSIDAEFLSRIAKALGKTEDAKRFESDRDAMNKRINDHLWNEELGIYCSRYWEVPPVPGPALDPQSIFKSGFNLHFYSDPAFLNEVAQLHNQKLDFDWGEASPAANVPATDWSARITADFTAPDSGTYRLSVGGDEYVRISIGGKPATNVMVDNREQRVVDWQAEAGKSYPIAIEYHRAPQGKAELHLNVSRLTPGKPGSDWITRLTPMNFYPVSAGAADKVRAEKTLSWMYREDKFWLPWILPTVAKDDPVFHEQTYWHGHVWAPSNYIVWLGMQKYADSAHQAEFARRGVSLFMRNWTDKRFDCENYRSNDGNCGDEPHYSWGALLDLIGLEAIAIPGPDFQPAPKNNPALKEHLVLHNVPFGGTMFKLETRDGNVTATPEATSPDEK
jgi:PA14 domain/Bacterial alpha-L-rhamnosidase 6 hairpin glycosidase domain/Glycosyl hydrolase family 63 C-terminal domain